MDKKVKHVAFDHLKLVQRDKREIERFIKCLRGAHSTCMKFHIMHGDHACCAIEEWEMTRKFVISSHFPELDYYIAREHFTDLRAAGKVHPDWFKTEK